LPWQGNTIAGTTGKFLKNKWYGKMEDISI
jgi:hypothetical protein